MAAKVQGVKNRRAAAIQQDEVLDSVKDLNLDSVSKSITDTQVEIQKVLADLSAKVMERLQELQNIESAIAVKRDDLKRMHEIEVKATTLDELEEQIARTRKEWEEEQARKKREFQEMQSERNKAWKREEDEYQYRIKQEHMKAEDAFALLMQQQERQNKERQDQLEKNWAERETELKKRENELVELRAWKEGEAERVKKAVNAEVAVATNSVKKEYETRMTLANKDAEMERKIAEQNTKSLHENNARLQQQIDQMKAGLEQAQRDLKEISQKALESASGRATTDALQRILEKDQPGAKAAK